jgi:uncharacterized OB-fold protein
MTARIVSFTTIHIGPQGPEAEPYAIVVAETDDGGLKAGRAEGDLSWLAIGDAVEVGGDAEGSWARRVGVA